jgi:hypothetical protein
LLPDAAKAGSIENVDRYNKIEYLGVFGGPGRDRTDDLFHAMALRFNVYNYLQRL